MKEIVIDIYEGSEKILRHTFYGKNFADALAVVTAHQKSDEFFDAAMRGASYKGIKPHAVMVKPHYRKLS